MTQMKEKNKTPEKQLNKMEISNLSDAEFKTLVIRMLKELIGYFNSIKKMQAIMKVTVSEIKKDLQGTNSGMGEAEIKSIIWDTRKKTIQNNMKKRIQNSMKKKESKNTTIG